MCRTFSNLSVACLLWALCSSCSGKPGPQVGGETHWLAACTQNDECGGTNLSCVCGTCTRACSGDAACTGSRDAACFDPNSPLLLQRCEDRSSDSSHGLCLPRCTKDVDCGNGRACVQRTCVPTALPDAGAASSTASVDAGVRISDFNSVSDSVSWIAPVTVPAPQLTIAGADERIIGTWNEVDCDPTQPSGELPWGCVSLSIERADSGEVTGSLVVHRPAANPYVGPPPPNGPFAPPTDPDVGYPTEIDPADYFSLVGNIAGNVPYRMLDGRFANDTLVAAWAPYDLWHDWCQLEKPYPWELGGHAFFFCVPQDEAAQTGIDKGKVALCTSGDFQPLCSDGHSGVQPCACMQPNYDYARCGPAYCHCDSRACDADLHSGQRPIRLTLVDGHLSGTWTLYLPESISLTLERVSP
jgi:hypothetical protein